MVLRTMPPFWPAALSTRTGAATARTSRMRTRRVGQRAPGLGVRGRGARCLRARGPRGRVRLRSVPQLVFDRLLQSASSKSPNLWVWPGQSAWGTFRTTPQSRRRRRRQGMRASRALKARAGRVSSGCSWWTPCSRRRSPRRVPKQHLVVRRGRASILGHLLSATQHTPAAADHVSLRPQPVNHQLWRGGRIWLSACTRSA
jgi:hypothetical protein